MTDDNLDDVQPYYVLRPVLQENRSKRKGLGRMDLSETLEQYQSRMAKAQALIRAARKARSREQNVGSAKGAGHRAGYWALSIASIVLVAVFIGSVLTAFNTLNALWLIPAGAVIYLFDKVAG